ncbi:hypothetical protein B0H10DRAFT_1961199 [Mycena sp. CBHHK59/15]|nr:hypothetical protein B0H10DRAFT_1961199 [Mycena sp. CBHHK59/15]
MTEDELVSASDKNEGGDAPERIPLHPRRQCRPRPRGPRWAARSRPGRRRTLRTRTRHAHPLLPRTNTRTASTTRAGRTSSTTGSCPNMCRTPPHTLTQAPPSSLFCVALSPAFLAVTRLSGVSTTSNLTSTPLSPTLRLEHILQEALVMAAQIVAQKKAWERHSRGPESLVPPGNEVRQRETKFSVAPARQFQEGVPSHVASSPNRHQSLARLLNRRGKGTAPRK